MCKCRCVLKGSGCILRQKLHEQPEKFHFICCGALIVNEFSLFFLLNFVIAWVFPFIFYILKLKKWDEYVLHHFQYFQTTYISTVNEERKGKMKKNNQQHHHFNFQLEKVRNVEAPCQWKYETKLYTFIHNTHTQNVFHYLKLWMSFYRMKLFLMNFIVLVFVIEMGRKMTTKKN